MSKSYRQIGVNTPVTSTDTEQGLITNSKARTTKPKSLKRKPVLKRANGRASRVRESSTQPQHLPTGTARKTKYDWKSAAAAYVEGFEEDGSIKFGNLREISERFDIPYTRVREVSSRDRWSEQRNSYQIEQAAAKRKNRLAKAANDAMDFDDNAFTTAKLGLAAVTARLAEIHAEAKQKAPLRQDALERLKRGEPVEKWELYSVYRPQDLDMLARAAQTFQAIGQRALGTDIQKVDVSVQHEGEVQHTHSVRQEMMRDDTERLAAIIEGLGQTDPRMREALGVIIDAEVVDDPQQEETPSETPLEIEA